MSNYLYDDIYLHLSRLEHLQHDIISGKIDRLPIDVYQENQCHLGKWIANEADNHNDEPKFEELRQKHALFHQYATDLGRKALLKDAAGAHALMNNQCRKTAFELMEILRRLKPKVDYDFQI